MTSNCWRGAAATVLVCALLTLSACANSRHSSPQENTQYSSPAENTRPTTPSSTSGPTAVQLDTFPLPAGAEQAVRFDDNESIFRAVVRTNSDPVLATPTAVPDATPIVYQPDTVLLTNVYKGPLTAGDVITIRALGGQ